MTFGLFVAIFGFVAFFGSAFFLVRFLSKI